MAGLQPLQQWLRNPYLQKSSERNNYRPVWETLTAEGLSRIKGAVEHQKQLAKRSDVVLQGPVVDVENGVVEAVRPTQVKDLE